MWLAPAPVWCGNLEDLPVEQLPRVDCITAGFPCQPWSQAGSQRGTDDDRWLWPAIARIIRDAEPAMVLLENVPGLISGGGLHFVLDDLATLGFDAEWGCVTAASVGASHRRERWFCVAYCECLHRERPRNSKDMAGSVGDEWCRDAVDGSNGDVVNAECPEPWNRYRPDVASGHVGHTGSQGLPQRRGERSDARTPGPHSRYAVELSGDTPIFAPGPGDIDGWRRVVEDGSFDFRAPAIKPGVRLLADGVTLVVDASRADQLRCAGNGVVPLQAAAAFVELLRRVNRGGR